MNSQSVTVKLPQDSLDLPDNFHMNQKKNAFFYLNIGYVSPHHTRIHARRKVNLSVPFVNTANITTITRTDDRTYIEFDHARFSHGIGVGPILQVVESVREIFRMLSLDQLPANWEDRGLKERC